MSEYKRTALVLGAGGFIGSHMVKRLRSEGYWVRGVDLKYPEFSETEANEFIQGDLRDANFVSRVIQFKGYQGNFWDIWGNSGSINVILRKEHFAKCPGERRASETS